MSNISQSHHEKRRMIVASATRFFAEMGYDRASMNILAQECGVSKGLLYHYFNSKHEILFAILQMHLCQLRDAVVKIEEANPQQKLLTMIQTLLALYEGADKEHQLQLNAMRLLSEAAQQELKDIQREIVRAFTQAVIALEQRPCPRKPAFYRALTMSLFGMLNWHYLWHHKDKDISNQHFAQLCLDMVQGGIAATDR